MKTFSLIAKILAAVAAVAGVIYIIATYGDKIVAWAKKLLSRSAAPCQIAADEDFVEEAAAETEEAPAAEEAAEEAVAEAVEEVVVEDNEPVADEADFEG